MNTKRSYLDNLNTGRQRRSGSALEEINRTLDQLESRLERALESREGEPAGEEDIARRAYEIWQQRGCPPGDGKDDWQAAETELLALRIPRSSTTEQRVRSWWSRLRGKLLGNA